MKVGYLTADWSNAFPEDNGRELQPGGSAWYRCHLPAAELSRNGHEAVVAEQVAASDRGLILRDQDGNDHDDIDVIVMQRIMNDAAYNLVRIAQDGGQAVVNDIDDWYWGLHESNRAYGWVMPESNPHSNLDHYRNCIEASDLVTCSTPFLAEQLQGWGVEVELVRNAIDLDRWVAHEQEEVPLVGWIGSTTHRSKDLETVAKPVGDFLERHDLLWYHGGWWPGSDHPYKLMDIPVERSRTARICSIYKYPNLFIPLDIGVVPLNMIPFNQAKSFIKGLEYAASGVPFVAQATDEYRLLGSSGLGRVALGEREWREHLESLVDPEVRDAEARMNLAKVEQFDIAERWEDWLNAYSRL